MTDIGTLYICPTPIGNLGDITLRVLEVLKNVDFIAAEDTRHSRKLLDYYNIRTQLISYHEHNEKLRCNELILRLKEGSNGALISDAGMPGISDPGHILIEQCVLENIPIDVLPGPNAAITALVLSGMPTDSFVYLGFLPAHKGERKKSIEKVTKLPYTLVIYEAPHRLVSTLEAIQSIMGERYTVVTRELTKIHQTVHRGMPSELIKQFNSTPPKGECCLLLAPYQEIIDQGEPSIWIAEVKEMEKQGVERKEAMKQIAKKHGIGKRDVYKAFLESDPDLI